MNFEQVRAMALAAAVDPTLEDFYREICREFAKTFHTPLKEVETYDPDYVLQHYLEERYKKLDDESLQELIFKTVDPEGYERDKQSLEDLIQTLESKGKKQSSPKPSSKVVHYEAEGGLDGDGEGLDDLDNLPSQ